MACKRQMGCKQPLLTSNETDETGAIKIHKADLKNKGVKAEKQAQVSNTAQPGSISINGQDADEYLQILSPDLNDLDTGDLIDYLKNITSRLEQVAGEPGSKISLDEKLEIQATLKRLAALIG